VIKGVGLLRGGREDEGKAVLAAVKEKYGALKLKGSTYGEFADAWLSRHPAADLEVGKKAPEIVGRTIDDKPIKLSDFKGRVVVIDFFGDW
jgi:hypothetical protein